MTLACGPFVACAVGPDFKHPTIPPAANYTNDPGPTMTAGVPIQGGGRQSLIPGRDIPGDWWSLFGAPALSRLVAQAMDASPNVTAAQATLRQAEQNAYATEGGFFPSLSAKDSIQRIEFSGDSIGQSYSATFALRTTTLNLSYTLDIFGSTRRQVEAALAQAENQRFQLEAAYLTLSSNVVVAAIQDASLRAQIAATQAIIDTKRHVLQTVQAQFAAGATSQSDVLAQESALAQSDATLPGLEHGLAVQRDLLSALLGQFPNDPPPEDFDFADLRLPADLPLSLPSSLVEQRPDIRSSEAQLHAATAQVGVATAAMIPQLSISASLGAISLKNFLQGGSPMSTIGGSLAQPLFQGGQLLHQRRAAVAAMLAAAAQYRNTVLVAFQNVADVLSALQTDAQAVAAQAAAEQAQEANLRIAQIQYASGAISFLSLLNAENSLAQLKVALIQAQTARFTDTAALYQALGGGWWHRADVATVRRS
jgi:NodT family efflux transporter outer membrane factor (OMF) lipoprotein